jgi:hypothetical protein
VRAHAWNSARAARRRGAAGGKGLPDRVAREHTITAQRPLEGGGLYPGDGASGVGRGPKFHPGPPVRRGKERAFSRPCRRPRAGKPDILVTAGTAATAAAKAATAMIPIVFYAVGDPVGSALVANLARPGWNVTGQGGLGPEMHGKMLELLKEAVPKASRMAVFVNSDFPLHTVYRNAIEPVARSLNVALKPFEVRAPKNSMGHSRQLRGKNSTPSSSSASR